MKPYYEHAGITIYHGDCLEVLPQLSARVDVLLTDPPFAFTGGISNGRTSECSDQFFIHWWKAVCDRLQKLLSNEGCGFIWCDWKTASTVAAGFAMRADHGYEPLWRVPQMLFHYREMPGQGQPFRSSVDMIAYARGPEHKEPPIPATTHNFISQYWYYGKHDHHPAEKSPDIAEKLIEWAGGLNAIIDPFMGSGTNLLAAKTKNRVAIGIEIEEKYCEIAAKRLSQEVLQFETTGEQS